MAKRVEALTPGEKRKAIADFRKKAESGTVKGTGKGLRTVKELGLDLPENEEPKDHGITRLSRWVGGKK